MAKGDFLTLGWAETIRPIKMKSWMLDYVSKFSKYVIFGCSRINRGAPNIIKLVRYSICIPGFCNKYVFFPCVSLDSAGGALCTGIKNPLLWGS